MALRREPVAQSAYFRLTALRDTEGCGEPLVAAEYDSLTLPNQEEYL